jgi:hypothetical protein
VCLCAGLSLLLGMLSWVALALRQGLLLLVGVVLLLLPPLLLVLPCVTVGAW